MGVRGIGTYLTHFIGCVVIYIYSLYSVLLYVLIVFKRILDHYLTGLSNICIHIFAMEFCFDPDYNIGR